MSSFDDRAEEAKGRVEKAAGDLTDDDDLRRKGTVDRASGKVKKEVEHAKGRVKDAVDGVADKLRGD